MKSKRVKNLSKQPKYEISRHIRLRSVALFYADGQIDDEVISVPSQVFCESVCSY